MCSGYMVIVEFLIICVIGLNIIGFVKINNCYDESNNELLIIIFSFFFGELGWLNLGIWRK